MTKKRPSSAKSPKKGRPSKLVSLNLSQVERLAGLGLTNLEIASVLGICEKSLYVYQKDEAFLQALKRGKARADEKVLSSLFDKAVGGDTTACIFWVKNRMPDRWKDKQEVGGSLELKGPAVFIMPRPGEKVEGSE